MRYILTVPGKPNGKQRPRVGKGGHIYSPADVDGFASKIQVVARMEHVERIPGPVAFEMYIVRAMPKSWSGRKRESLDGTYAVGKPDIDNVLKSAMDALTGIAWVDDTAVAKATVSRVWGECDGVTIEIAPEGPGG